jgi:SAM-dependent methyltransferase
MNSQHVIDQPSAWIVRFAPLIAKGEALDLACGSGRHARHLAALGHDVLAVDRDPAALEHLPQNRIRVLQFDLEEQGAERSSKWPLKKERFQGIVVTNYLHRPLLPAILESLVPGGILIYETFAAGNERFGKPSNPDFLLQPGELLKMAQAAEPALHVVAFEQGYVDLPKPAMIQRICLLKPQKGAELLDKPLYSANLTIQGLS